MKTLVVKIPDELDAELTRAAKARHVTKSALVRERLGHSGAGAHGATTMWDLVKDLVIDNGDLPTDLSTNKKHMEGYGKSRADR